MGPFLTKFMSLSGLSSFHLGNVSSLSLLFITLEMSIFGPLLKSWRKGLFFVFKFLFTIIFEFFSLSWHDLFQALKNRNPITFWLNFPSNLARYNPFECFSYTKMQIVRPWNLLYLSSFGKQACRIQHNWRKYSDSVLVSL